ncbi:prepilin peptidase [Euzebya tangerina]|uniref:prepilin peptidase n=1 Tax=Euzebya tangerina TaxID=591198 RepID=UPI000E30F8B2|nr:A24 family peptidase [Euzebya tangerina]
MAVLTAVICGVFGLLFGSFGNVVIHRVPEGQSVVSPPSACPGCGNSITPRDNIPVLSWLVLRGRCRNCGEPISVRYPIVELASAALFALTGYVFASADPPDFWVLPGMLLFVWVLLIVSVIDVETRRIPNAITYTLTPALAVLLVSAAVLNGEPGRALTAVAGGAGAFVFLLILALIKPGGMGFGDVKYAAFLGLGLGYVSLGSVLIGIFGAFLVGSLVSVALLALTDRSRKDKVPFGPFLSVGAFVGILIGPALVEAYTSAVGL